MVRYNFDNLSQDTAKCAYCHNSLLDEDYTFSTGGEVCCSTACAVLADENSEASALPAVICTNCDAACADAEHIIFSADGLPFCSGECANRYPKTVYAPEVRRVLYSAVAGMLLAAVVVLLVIIEGLPSVTRNP